MNPFPFSPVTNHLWQSTLVVLLAGLLTLPLRQNAARIRYRVWMAASLKFLLPFSLLLAAGNRVHWSATPSSALPVTAAIQQFSQTLALSGETPPAILLPPVWWTELLFAAWFAGFAIVSLRWWARWRQVRHALSGASPLPIVGAVPVMTSNTPMEPGIFGLFRPVLLLPTGIEARLPAAQLQAILAHEFCHVRRRDNWSAALHMLVEALFWFHPLVWWLGSRLVEEREHACDEEVLQSGSDPEAYAAGILSVCRFYLESPLPCAAGVTGSDLKKRIEAIMTSRGLRRLTTGRRVLLVAASVAAVGGPLLVGMAAQSGTPLRFEVASIKPTKDGSLKYGLNFLPGGGLKMDGISLKGLIAFAYEVPEERITGGPKWMASDAYDILAKAEKAEAASTELEAATAAPGSPVWNRTRLRTQELLKDRFQLAIHMDTKENSGYALVIAKGGAKVKASASTNPPSMMRSRGRIDGRGGSIGMLAAVLQNYLGHPVVDQTGLAGTYDFALTYAQESSAGEMKSDDMGISVLAALEEQLGLKLEKSRVEIKTIVVDHAEKATAN